MKKRIQKLTVGVIFGGKSGEHEVSLASARSVLRHLDKRKYHVVPIAISKDGKWLAGPDAFSLVTTGQVNAINAHPERIVTPNPKNGGLVVTQGARTSRAVRPQKLDVVFPVLHGPLGEDGSIQGLLELANIPYVGPGVLGSAAGMDKDIMKRLFLVAGLPVIEYISFTSVEWRSKRKSVIRSIKKLGWPIFVKPANMGSSVGISKVHQESQLSRAVTLALTYDRKVVIERALPNARDIECAVLGNDRPRASVVGEILSSGEFYDYDAKYVDGKSQAVIPARIPRRIYTLVRKLAVRAFQAVDACGMGRVDFLLRGTRLYVNEINTIPGFTDISMYPKLWEASGLSYTKLLDELLRLAISRHAEKQVLARTYIPKRTWHRSSDTVRR